MKQTKKETGPETLRRAAALIRGRATIARAGRWTAEGPDVAASWTTPQPVATCHGSIEQGNAVNADHIAGMDPPVAALLADWLEVESGKWDGARERNSSFADTYYAPALTFALTYLRENDV